MFMVGTDCDVPGFREEPKYSDQELEDMENEKLDRASQDAAMERDMPYVDYEFAFNKFVEVADIKELEAARQSIDEAIVAFLMKTHDTEAAAIAARAHTKQVMKRFKIPDPTRKPRDDRGHKRK